MDEDYPHKVQGFVGTHKLSLQSPSLCISLPVVNKNAARFYESIRKSGVHFRPHLKTNKTTETTRIMLGDISKAVAISTLREAYGLESLIAGGQVQDILYAIPISPSVLPDLDRLSTKVTARLMVDHIDQINMLNNYVRSDDCEKMPWSVYIKLDLGSRRAGVTPKSRELSTLIEAIECGHSIELCGICSYPDRMGNSWSLEKATLVLQEHISVLKDVANLRLDTSRPLVLAIGSSITARVIDSIPLDLPSSLTLEVVAGTFIYNDLQQLATNTISRSDLAMTVITEVCSVYNDRNEALINAGVLALTREPQDISGIARVRGTKSEGWVVGRVSQEHGILVYTGKNKCSVKDTFSIGDKLELDVQHTCIVGAMFGWHFVTDEENIVRDVYFPWKWW